jgi:hypothetical protein
MITPTPPDETVADIADPHPSQTADICNMPGDDEEIVNEQEQNEIVNEEDEGKTTNTNN